MAFTMPQVEIVRDSARQPCLRAGDAQAVADALATDPAQPFHFNHSCSFRAELMIGRLLEGSLPPEIVHRAFIEAVNESAGEKFHASGRKSPPGSSFQNLVGKPATYPADVPLPGTAVTIHFEDADSILVHGPGKDRGWPKDWAHFRGKGFNFTADGEWSEYGNHVTVALSVLNEKTNRAEIKVIDPFLTSPPRLLSFAEWKAMQNCDSAIILGGPVGRLPDIVAEDGCLRPQDAEKMTTLILENAPDLAPDHPGVMTPDELRDAMAHMDRQAANRVTAAMMNIDLAEHPNHAPDPRCLCGINFEKFADIGGSIGYGDRRASDSQRTDHGSSCDWDCLSPDDRRELIQRWVDELAPLAAVDKKWRERFMSVDKAPTPDMASAAPAYTIA